MEHGRDLTTVLSWLSMTETTPRAIRIPDDLWAAALGKASERDETVSEVVRNALERYVKR